MRMYSGKSGLKDMMDSWARERPISLVDVYETLLLDGPTTDIVPRLVSNSSNVKLNI